MTARAFTLSAIFTALTLASVGVRGQSQPSVISSATDAPLVMDTLTVTAKRDDITPSETWYYTKLQDIDVYSNGSERATKRLLKDFSDFRIALDSVWPIKAKQRQPLTLILCAHGKFERFIPKADGANVGNDVGRASATLVGPEGAYIILNIGTPTLLLGGSDDDTTGIATYEVDYYRLLYREYIHYLLSQTDTPPPAWYEEGIAQILMKMDITPTEIVLGKISEATSASTNTNAPVTPPIDSTPDAPGIATSQDDSATADETTADSDIVSDGDFNVALRHHALLDFNDFFGVTADSPIARNPIGNNVWAKQCYAFVHMCRFGAPNKYRKALETFVVRSAKEPVTEQLFTECFGKPYKKVLLELRSYISFTSYKYDDSRTEGKTRIDEPAPELKPASEGESSRIQGDALLLANNAMDAVPVLLAAYGRGERNPQFLATCGLVAVATNQPARARRTLAQATAANTTRVAAYPAYARLLLADAIAKPASPDGKHLSPQQLAEVLTPLFTSLKLRPPLKQTYELIAEAWSESTAVPTTDNFGVIAEGIALYPTDPELLYQTARVTLSMNDAKATAALITRALQFTSDATMRSKLAALKTQSEAASAER